MTGLFPTVVPLQAAEPVGMDMSFFLVMGVIFLIFYMLVMRPQQKRQREHEAALKAVGKGDRVITTGGTTTQKTVDGGKRASSLVGGSVEARESHWLGPVPGLPDDDKLPCQRFVTYSEAIEIDARRDA